MATRRRIVAGNWKMNLDRAGAFTLAQAVATGAQASGNCNLILCPPAIYLDAVATALELNNGQSPSGVALGGQNLHDQPKGAFTGEVAPGMLVDIGCTFCIVGHSERRTLFGETDSVVNTKAKAVLAAGLTPIICVGETLEEREQDRTAAVVTEQIAGSLAGPCNRPCPVNNCVRTCLGNWYRQGSNARTGPRSPRPDTKSTCQPCRRNDGRASRHPIWWQRQA